jgi:hypothetical protein
MARSADVLRVVLLRSGPRVKRREASRHLRGRRTLGIP